jgi:hypothetical protein
MIFTDLNIGIFLHQNSEDDRCSLILRLELKLIVRDWNQSNPSAGSSKIFCLRTGRTYISFFMPFATHLQPFATRAVWHGKKSTF